MFASAWRARSFSRWSSSSSRVRTPAWVRASAFKRATSARARNSEDSREVIFSLSVAACASKRPTTARDSRKAWWAAEPGS